MADWTWRLRDRTLTPGDPPLIMGIVNATPDSFSDGGRFLDTDAAVAQALRLAEQGADLLDIGGESTRPGAHPVSLEEELSRVLPIIRCLAAQTTLPLSVDTSKAEIARQALEAGAHIINDITALQGDPAMPEVARTYQAGVLLMHMQGTPATMQANPHYDEVVTEVAAFLEARLQACADVGIAGSQVVLDPGIGFGKTPEQSITAIARLAELESFGLPLLVGASRKRFIDRILPAPPDRRLGGSIAAHLVAVMGGAAIIRAHDVAETVQALRVAAAIESAR
jgi:dihydropteroate synthase